LKKPSIQPPASLSPLQPPPNAASIHSVKSKEIFRMAIMHCIYKAIYFPSFLFFSSRFRKKQPPLIACGLQNPSKKPKTKNRHKNLVIQPSRKNEK
jgi:hypothetical protein